LFVQLFFTQTEADNHSRNDALNPCGKFTACLILSSMIDKNHKESNSNMQQCDMMTKV